MLTALLDFLTDPFAHMPDHQVKAVGARHIWKMCHRKDDADMNKWLARVCIKMQTYYKPEVA